MKLSRYVVLAALSIPVQLGCAALPTVAKIVSAVNDAEAVLNIVERAVDTWFSVRPDEDKQVKANRLISSAWTALRAANAAAMASESISQEEYDKAFAEFSEAYAELHKFLSENGILSDGRLGIGNGVTEEIPAPTAIGMRLR